VSNLKIKEKFSVSTQASDIYLFIYLSIGIRNAVVELEAIPEISYLDATEQLKIHQPQPIHHHHSQQQSANNHKHWFRA
jgi:hypothetical protein